MKKGSTFICSMFFSFLFFIFHGILLASKFLVCLHFPADGCEKSREIKKEISKFHAPANSQERRKRK